MSSWIIENKQYNKANCLSLDHENVETHVLKSKDGKYWLWGQKPGANDIREIQEWEAKERCLFLPKEIYEKYFGLVEVVE